MGSLPRHQLLASERRRSPIPFLVPLPSLSRFVLALDVILGPQLRASCTSRAASASRPHNATISHSQMVILNVGLRVRAFTLAGLFVSRALWTAVAIPSVGRRVCTLRTVATSEKGASARFDLSDALWHDQRE